MEPAKWKAVIGKHLPKRARQLFRTIQLDIIVVDCGIKPSYLYDISAPDAETLSKFISELKHEGLIKNNLAVLCVGMDCFIVNSDALKHIYRGITPATLIVKLVDVSATLPQPVLCEDTDIVNTLVTAVTSLVEKLSYEDKTDMPSQPHLLSNGGTLGTDAGNYLVFDPSVNCNISSVFGLLLGYPVVYWYQTADTHVGNCLSMEPLVCVKLLGISEPPVGSQPSHEHEIYSFSYPVCLKGELIAIVDDWVETVQHKVRQYSHVFVDCNIRIEEISCEAVCL